MSLASKNDEIAALTFSERRILSNWFNVKAVKNKASYFWITPEYKKTSPLMATPKFKSIVNGKYEWHLKHRPTSGSVLGEFTLYLCSSNVIENTKIYFNCKLTFLSNNGNEVLESGLRCVRLFPQMVSQDWKCCSVSNAGDKYLSKVLHNSRLYISCEVEFSIDDFCEYAPSEADSNGAQFSVSEDIVSLMKNNLYTDVTISVKDKEFQAHKLILAARSPVFAAMFNQTMKESATNRVEIEDLDPEVVEDMLNFIYTGKCENLHQFSRGLLVASEKYDLKVLKVMCEQALLKNIECENAASILLLADLHHADRLKLNVIEFILAAPFEIISSTTWDNFMVESPKLAKEVYDAMARRLSGLPIL